MANQLAAIALSVTTAVLAAGGGDAGGASAPSTTTTEGVATTEPATTGATTPSTIPAQRTRGDWPVSTAEENGIDSALLADALVAVGDEIPHVHSVTIARNGSVFVDAYFSPYDGTSPHDVASVTKSVTTTLVGIAIDQDVLALDDRVLSFFGDREIANRDERKERMTIEHLASMTSGFGCDAEPDEPTLAAMQASEDYVQFALDVPMVAEPGTTFSYCSPGMHLLSAILTEATGMTEFEFAQEYLFGPLGFGTVFWPEDPQGYSHGWGDAVMHPRDMAKLGQLYVNGGVWSSEQIVSQTWIDAAVSIHASTDDDGTGYGFGWWIEQDPTAGGEFGAVGRGGQFITVIPTLDAVVVVTGGAGEFDDSEVLDLIAPAIVNPAGALPANPQATAKLAATLDTLLAQPEPQPFSLPNTASTVSGVTYLFEAGNSLGVESLRVTFDDSSEADIEITFSDRGDTFAGPIGLDDVFRTSPGTWGLPSGTRGAWTDEQTFVFERDEIANNSALIVSLRFDGDDITMEVRERTVEGSVSISGTKSLQDSETPDAPYRSPSDRNHPGRYPRSERQHRRRGEQAPRRSARSALSARPPRRRSNPDSPRGESHGTRNAAPRVDSNSAAFTAASWWTVAMADRVDDAALALRQAALQSEADELLAAIAEIDALHDIGPLLATGSYVSGLMCWRDLDVGALVGPDFTPIDVIDVVTGVLAAAEIPSFTYRDERGSRSPTGEQRDERYHVPLQMAWNSIEWRFDLTLWLFDDHANVADWHHQLGQRISPEQRRAVLRIKDVWCRRPDYPDEVSGAEIYSAVLDDGIRTPDAFSSWLLEYRSSRNIET